MSTRERTDVINIRAFFVVLVNEMAFAWVINAAHLEIALRFQRLTVYESGARIVKPSQKRIVLRSQDPFVVPSKVSELRLFRLEHVGHATRSNHERSKPVAERLRLDRKS